MIETTSKLSVNEYSGQKQISRPVQRQTYKQYHKLESIVLGYGKFPHKTE